jgi:hypothetical protein
MLFVVVERFQGGDAGPIEKRFRTKGRMMPEGVAYRESWVELSGMFCFQLMKTDSRELRSQLTKHWDDLLDFGIVAGRAVCRVLGQHAVRVGHFAKESFCKKAPRGDRRPPKRELVPLRKYVARHPNSVGAKTCRRADSSRVCLDCAPRCRGVLGDYLRLFFAFLFSSTAA